MSNEKEKSDSKFHVEKKESQTLWDIFTGLGKCKLLVGLKLCSTKVMSDTRKPFVAFRKYFSNRTL